MVDQTLDSNKDVEESQSPKFEYKLKLARFLLTSYIPPPSSVCAREFDAAVAAITNRGSRLSINRSGRHFLTIMSIWIPCPTKTRKKPMRRLSKPTARLKSFRANKFLNQDVRSRQQGFGVSILG